MVSEEVKSQYMCNSRITFYKLLHGHSVVTEAVTVGHEHSIVSEAVKSQ